MKILFISGFLPSARVPSGGQQLVAKILAKAAVANEITLLTFQNEKEAEYSTEGAFTFCRETRIFQITKFQRILAAIRFPHLPLIASSRRWLAGSWLAKTLEVESFDEISIEFIQSGGLLSKRHLAKTSFIVHDLFHEAIRRRKQQSQGLKKWILTFEEWRTKRWEAEILRTVGKLSTLTEKDRVTIQQITGRNDVVVRYPECDDMGGGQRDPSKIRPGAILFFGQMSRDENVDAVVWFARDILPLVKKTVPNAFFIVAGVSPRAEVLALKELGVEVTGFVDSPRDLFATCQLAVAPLRLGAGVKIKVIEYLSGGLPTVATTVGAEGVQSNPLLTIAENEIEIARACVEKLSKQE